MKIELKKVKELYICEKCRIITKLEICEHCDNDTIALPIYERMVKEYESEGNAD